MNIEKRVINAALEVRSSEDEKSSILTGRAVPFNELSEDLGGFRERIAPGAFDLNVRDIKALWSHDTSRVIGSTRVKTLKLEEKSSGIDFELDLPDTTTGRDAATTIERGDVDGVSFGFIVHQDTFEQIDGDVVRTVLRGDLIEISPVAFPAYSQTDVSAELRERIASFTDTEAEEDHEEDDATSFPISLLQKQLDLLELE